MTVPDDVIEEVAGVVLAILERDAPCSCLPAYKVRGLDDPQCTYHDVLGSEIDTARAFFSVPSVAAVFARAFMSEAEYTAASQRWVDEVCYYRNLAIANGAKPTEMLNERDRRLCVDGLADFADAAQERAEIIELWDQVDAAEAAVARDTKVREIVERPRFSARLNADKIACFDAIAVLYAESVGGSDIMPGSEFDGPVTK